MSLEITNENGVFIIKGILDLKNSTAFKKHFEYLLDFIDSIRINLTQLKKIDPAGRFAIESIYRKAKSCNKAIEITF